MRIAQVAPLYESVPPAKYGGTERVVSYLTEELVRQGHEVTLYASGDSKTAARLVAACPRSLRTDPDCADAMAPHAVELDLVRRDAREFDAIHFHTGYGHFPLARALPTPHLTTLHGRLDLPDLVPLFEYFDDEPLVSISDSQRRPIQWANWIGTVHHGLPPELLRFGNGCFGGEPEGAGPRDGRYVAFVGRISPEKAPDRAIEIARRAGVHLRIAAKVDAVDREYFARVIEPLLVAPGVEFIGELDDRGKEALLGGAAALLFPIDWPEPFGLVMIEALACGTPVIARPRGSVTEVIADGRTGMLCESIEDAVAAIARIDAIDRRACRREFERRFQVARMAEEYVRLYERIAAAPSAAGSRA